MKYTKEIINGLSCIFAPMEDTNAITIEIMCKAGSVYEDQNINGISHFLEHLFFKGGKKYLTPKAVTEAADKFGGEFNAYTGDEYAGYYIKCAPQHIVKAIDILGDMLINAQFPKEELEREKGVVIQELKMYEDNPMSLVMEKRQQNYFGNNSFGRGTIGTIENIKSFNQDMLFKYKQELYTKDNLIITVAGKIEDLTTLRDLIAITFASLPEKSSRTKPLFTGYHNTSSEGNFIKKTEQNHLIISMPGCSGEDKNKYALNALATIVGGNMSSRLFQNIREKEGLCYYIRAANYSSKDHGEFVIRAGIDKERFAFAREKIDQEIHQLMQEGITDDEFINAIGYNEGQLQMGIESSDEMASFLATQELVYGEIKTIQDVLAAYKALTKEDINAMIPLLAKDNRYSYWIE